jgi:heme/copper-type cytochrome/quinol oxidase subunit 3
MNGQEARDPKRDGRLVEQGRLLDVSTLPTFAFGHRSPMWWGTMGLMLIEGTVFALTVMSYFYLRSHAAGWPMSRLPPELVWGNVNTAIMLISMVPNHFAKKAAERLDLQKVRFWLVACLLVSILFLGVRVLEFGALNTRWDSNAYGSVVWMLMGLHTTHLVTDAYDSAVLTVLTFTGPMEGKRYVDISENAAYWYFVVLSWIPIYLVVYWGARF